MKPFTLRDALKAVEGRYVGNEAVLDSMIESVTSDSRKAGPGSLFIPLKGTRVDGHDFMAACIAAGAVANLSEREPAPNEQPAIVVDSTVRATGALATWHRSRFDIPVIGITGSVGKTTTKEMIAAVVSQRFQTHKTQRNLNNELGVPWTLMGLEDAHQVAVVEMGISDFGEMRRLTHMVRPDIAVFTVIGDAHLEFLGDRAGVMRAKGEIFEGMDAQGLAVLNGDAPIQRACHPDMRRMTYGLSEGCDVRGANVRNLGEDGMRMTIHHPKGAFEVRIPAFGSHLPCAALAAAAVGLALGMTGDEIARGIARYQTVGDRARVIHARGMTVVSDCYNANPNSCQAAVDSLMQLQGKRRVCILGDMLELGPRTEALHRGVGEYAARAGVDLVVGCGPLSRAVADGARDAGGEVLYFEDKDRLLGSLWNVVRPGDCVLVKASHSMAFESVVERLTEE